MWSCERYAVSDSLGYIYITGTDGDTWAWGLIRAGTKITDITFKDEETVFVITYADYTPTCATGDIYRIHGGRTIELIMPFDALPGMNSIVFGEGGRGWIVGKDGAVLHTTNSGIDWSDGPSPTSSTLLKVLYHRDRLFAMSASTLFESQDEGASWQQVSTTPTSPLQSMLVQSSDRLLLWNDREVYSYEFSTGQRTEIFRLEPGDDDITSVAYYR